jgi:hypothetical protein
MTTATNEPDDKSIGDKLKETVHKAGVALGVADKKRADYIADENKRDELTKATGHVDCPHGENGATCEACRSMVLGPPFWG